MVEYSIAAGCIIALLLVTDTVKLPEISLPQDPKPKEAKPKDQDFIQEIADGKINPDQINKSQP